VGIDFLDIEFRIEKEFGIALQVSDLNSVSDARDRSDITAGELHFIIGCKLRESGRPVPRSIWNKVRIVLSQALGVSPHSIKPESWIIKDLGAC
jgi:hypothetical protein